MSPAAFPSAIRQAVERNCTARDVLGPELGHVIPPPLAQWESQGISCALFRQFQPLSNWRLTRHLQMRRMTPKVLSWLRGVAQLDRGVSGKAERSLRALADCPCEAIQEAALGAFNRVKSGAFIPRNRVMHGDLWSGNLLLDPSGERDFIVIDWGGSHVDGFPIFDLVRFVESARIPASPLRRELGAHAERLECDLADTRIYLLAALGLIWHNLGQFPAERFSAMATRNLQTLEAALNE